MNTEFISVANEPVWASSAASGDVHEVSAASPAITRADGFDGAYSLANGKQIEYQTMNQILRELYSAGKEIKRGVSAWDASIGYKQGGITLYDNHFYIALADSTGAAPSVSPSKWKRYTEYEGAPDPVRDIEFDMSNPSLIKVKWAQQRDNGRRITSYTVTIAGRSGSISTTYSDLALVVASSTSLSAKRIALAEGESFTITITATSPNGTSSARSATSPPLRFLPPFGGRDLPLAAKGGNQSVALEWIAPPDGGSPITGYIVQWRGEASGYEEGNKRKIGASLTYKVDGLSNDAPYVFRVKAINDKGEGEWSNEATATPSFSIYDADFPTLGAPDLDRTTTRITGDTNITPSGSKPTRSIQAIEWNYRPDGERGWRAKTTSASQEFWAGGLGPGWWNVRYRIKASVGYSAWSPTARIQIGAAAPEPPSVSVIYSPIRPTASHRREQTLTLITLRGDGGSAVQEVEIYGESGSKNGTSFGHGYKRNIRPINYGHRIVPKTTEQFNKDLALMYSQRNQKIQMFWTHATGHPRETFKSYVRAKNQYGWSDWAESNTLRWGET